MKLNLPRPLTLSEFAQTIERNTQREQQAHLRDSLLVTVLPRCLHDDNGLFVTPQQAVGRAIAYVEEAMRQRCPATPADVIQPDAPESAKPFADYGKHVWAMSGQWIADLERANVHAVLAPLCGLHLSGCADWIIAQRPDLEAAVHAAVMRVQMADDPRD